MGSTRAINHVNKTGTSTSVSTSALGDTYFVYRRMRLGRQTLLVNVEWRHGYPEWLHALVCIFRMPTKAGIRGAQDEDWEYALGSAGVSMWSYCGRRSPTIHEVFGALELGGHVFLYQMKYLFSSPKRNFGRRISPTYV